jgi:hypothetical protein
MARQKGILKIKGTVGGMTFYRTQDGHLVKEKSEISADKIANDPAFARTRENGEEFGNAASSGKFFRDQLRNLMMNAADNRVTSRITKLMTDIKNMDTTSQRGKRNVGTAMAGPAAKYQFKGFNFNDLAILGSIIFKPYEIDPMTGNISFTGLTPINDLSYPVGATHFSITQGVAKMNFASQTADVLLSNPANLPINGVSQNINLLLQGAMLPPGDVLMWLLKIEFFQQVNGQQYSLKNGAYNALSIVEIM